mmetsp:Transcript_44453/g.81143  ORF Transcript_44453/g.81143 Transcript_44453/m.81143 type:complete len:571 (+) Transcript_44453:69-1781(+)
MAKPQRALAAEGTQDRLVVKGPCRICHSTEESLEDPLVAPCLCDGSMRYVHNSCQQAWMSVRRGRLTYTCELCHAQLAYRLALPKRMELITSLAVSLLIWVIQVNSTLAFLQLMRVQYARGRLSVSQDGIIEDVAIWRKAGNARWHTIDESILDAEVTARQCLIGGILVIASGSAFLQPWQRYLHLVGEEWLQQLCSLKYRFCVLALLFELLITIARTGSGGPPRLPYPVGEAIAGLRIMSVIAFSDVLLNSFLMVPLQDRHGYRMLREVTVLAMRLTLEGVPKVLYYVLWLACIAVIAISFGLPAMLIVFKEAMQELALRKFGHGTVQVALMLLCLTTRLLSIVAPSPPHVWKEDTSQILLALHSTRFAWLCELAASTIWLVGEAAILGYVLRARRSGVELRVDRDRNSQMLWIVAITVQGLLAMQDYSELRNHSLVEASSSLYILRLTSQLFSTLLPATSSRSGRGAVGRRLSWPATGLLSRRHIVPKPPPLGLHTVRELAGIMMMLTAIVVHGGMVSRIGIRRLKDWFFSVVRTSPNEVVFRDRTMRHGSLAATARLVWMLPRGRTE